MMMRSWKKLGEALLAVAGHWRHRGPPRVLALLSSSPRAFLKTAGKESEREQDRLPQNLQTRCFAYPGCPYSSPRSSRPSRPPSSPRPIWHRNDRVTFRRSSPRERTHGRLTHAGLPWRMGRRHSEGCELLMPWSRSSRSNCPGLAEGMVMDWQMASSGNSSACLLVSLRDWLS